MTFPNVSGALWGWTSQARFRVVSKTVSDFEVVETGVYEGFGEGGFGLGDYGGSAPTYFMGSFQPMKATRLIVKPEGQRRWQWFVLTTQKVLSLDDVVVDAADVQFRVMTKQNWAGAGFYRYELVQMPVPADS